MYGRVEWLPSQQNTGLTCKLGLDHFLETCESLSAPTYALLMGFNLHILQLCSSHAWLCSASANQAHMRITKMINLKAAWSLLFGCYYPHECHLKNGLTVPKWFLCRENVQSVLCSMQAFTWIYNYCLMAVSPLISLTVSQSNSFANRRWILWSAELASSAVTMLALCLCCLETLITICNFFQTEYFTTMWLCVLCNYVRFYYYV